MTPDGKLAGLERELRALDDESTDAFLKRMRDLARRLDTMADVGSYAVQLHLDQRGATVRVSYAEPIAVSEPAP